MPAPLSADCTGNCSQIRADRSSAGEVAAIADPDARENWQFVLAFRDLLLRHPTLEAAYLALVRSRSIVLPPLFVNQLVHVILRNALDGCEDPFVLRSAELFFRPQRIMPHEHSLLLGDEEVIGGRNPTPVLSLMSLLGAHDRRASRRAQRGERRQLLATQRTVRHGTGSHRRQAGAGCACTSHDALDFSLARIDIAIEPLTELRDAKLTWYVGLDSEATGIGDELWHGETLDERTAASRACAVPSHLCRSCAGRPTLSGASRCI